ncbi:hypothetical protein IQE94_00800 [Synechocystis sp. PCC 7339]|uniref:ribbon-helix-helix domain-containing protein n=1 Tax=unclassified Synechocystis TaxID=2640012 RepID=UPI001BB01C0B|nr:MULTISPECIES: ribbon-helix-helix domain-containing protein [unclassified Synechocystis]QUS60752.1 hypothetical protein HTZ78_08750 [Synechocystis sp. PCC 7338]UAJ72937.1 hypothetical protein IQE94_00800 [Synechocystis sp. PCC 7339]
MSCTANKQRISVTVDVALLKNIDRLTENRSTAVEEGLRLWYQRHLEEQLLVFYQQQSQESQKFDQDWADFAQSEIEHINLSEGI